MSQPTEVSINTKVEEERRVSADRSQHRREGWERKRIQRSIITRMTERCGSTSEKGTQKWWMEVGGGVVGEGNKKFEQDKSEF